MKRIHNIKKSICERCGGNDIVDSKSEGIICMMCYAEAIRVDERKRCAGILRAEIGSCEDPKVARYTVHAIQGWIKEIEECE